MSDFPNNNGMPNNDQPAKQDKQPVNVKKKNFLIRVGDAIIMRDWKGMAAYFWSNSIKKTLIGLADSGLTYIKNSILYGEEAARETIISSAGKTSSGPEYVDYTKGGKTANGAQTNANRSPNGIVTDLITWSTEDAATRAIVNLRGRLQAYGRISVNDYFDIADKVQLLNGDYTKVNLGWRSMDGIRTVQLANGNYVVRFPSMEVLD